MYKNSQDFLRVFKCLGCGQSPRHDITFCNYSNYNCNNDYNLSSAKKTLDNWARSKFNTNDLVSVNGYKYRLINMDDLSNLGYTYDHCVNTSCQQKAENAEVVKFFQSITGDEKTIWTMEGFNDDVTKNLFMNNSGMIYQNPIQSIKAINPVININKDALLNNSDSDNKTSYKRYKSSYKFGEEVIYNDETYYVFKDSNDKEEYVTLLKDKPLTKEEIQKYYKGEIRDLGKYGLVSNNYLDYNNPSPLKIIVDGWVEDAFGDDSYELDSYKARLLTADELVEDLYFEYDKISSDEGYIAGEDTPNWVVQGYVYWSMSGKLVIGNRDQGAYHTDTLDGYFAAIRPVVNVKKNALSSNDDCDLISKIFSITKFKSYIQGEKVIYNNEEYYVATNSPGHLSRVTLIKEHPLTADEIDLYGYDNNGRNIVNIYPYSGNAEYIFSDFGYTLGQNDYRRVVYVNTVMPNKAYRYPSGVGGMQYYASETCGMKNNDTIEISGCKKNYDESYVKIVIDNWAKNKTNLNDLVSVNGYKVRLINKDESLFMNNLKNYIYFGSSPNNPEFDYWIKGDDYDYNNGDYIPNDNVLVSSYTNSCYSNGLIYKIIPPDPGYYGSTDIRAFTYPAVWPVININKCALEGACVVEEISMRVCDDPEPIIPEEPEEPENHPTIIPVDNTKKVVSMLAIALSIMMICGGTFILFFNYIKHKAQKK